jgi:hypothetical protein
MTDADLIKSDGAESEKFCGMWLPLGKHFGRLLFAACRVLGWQ